MKKYDIIIVGGGIMGLSHAYHALRKKKSVLLLEKNHSTLGASIRNFGQIVPSGFGAEWQAYGIRSLYHYENLLEQYHLPVRKEGSVYIASDEDEIKLIEELHQINTAHSYPSELWEREQLLQKYPLLQKDYAQAGLYFSQEMNVDSRNFIPEFSRLLEAQFGLSTLYGATVTGADITENGVMVSDASGNKYAAEKLIVCNGDDFKTLLPEYFPHRDIVMVKLQMMETIAQNILIPGSILTGWTIRRYECFKECPSYEEVISKQDVTSYHLQNGVHILFKQTATGTVILGDSHIYASIEGADQFSFQQTDTALNDFIIREASKIMQLDYTIASYWQGYYSQLRSGPVLQINVQDRIHTATCIGGKGMTASLGWAEQHIDSILQK
jgi:FAD dependent oxidoreductase TIGR03364